MDRNRQLPCYLTALVGFSALLLVGCSDMKYTVHIEKSLESARIPQSTIAVFPIDELKYLPPPGGCMNPTPSTSGSKEIYEAKWNEKVRSSIAERFPAQKFVFLNKDEGLLSKNGGVDFLSIVEVSKECTRAVLINAIKPDSICFESTVVSAKMRDYLKLLRQSTGAQYAIVFIAPSLAGETNTYWSSAGSTGHFGYGYGGFGAPNTYRSPTMHNSTIYTADVKALVWECATGRLLFSSGGWSTGSSSCFSTPESAAIGGANRKLERNLDNIISKLITYNSSIRFADGKK